ncbi:MAG: DUF6359 domain-containing protein [Paludibacteraceae bacterium]
MKRILFYGLAFAMLSLINIACSNSDDYIPNFSTDDSGKIIYSELFSDSIRAFTAVNVSGDQEWVYDSHGYAYITGYVSNANHANEDWLISPEIDLTDVSAAYFTFDHVARYFGDFTSEPTIWISEDYTSGPTSGSTWTQVKTRPFTDPGSWTFSTTEQLSLTQYAGKKIKIAFKYLATDTKAGSWEIKNFTVVTGEAVVVNYDYGAGTKTDPYTVIGAVSNQTGSNGWVKGTIVGYIVYGNPTTYHFTADNCDQNTNLLIADSISGYFLSRCVAVQLPPGAVRNELNLVNNPANLGKQVTMYGSLASYFGMAGLKNVSYYELEDGTSGGSEPFDPADAVFYETFESNLGQFTQQNVLGTETWVYNSTYKCAYITGYVSSQNRANEDWLISPEIDLSGKTNAILTFDHALRYNATPASDATVWISENYTSGLPATASWAQLPTAFTDGSTWDFVNIGDISLAEYTGKKIKIALKYKATTTKAGTWEVKNFVVK